LMAVSCMRNALSGTHVVVFFLSRRLAGQQ
jgi:hypothetical protein